MFKTDVLLIHSVKIVMMPEELKSVFNVLPQPTEFLLFHNMLVFARKVSMTIKESASHVHQAVLSAQMPQFVKDALSQLPIIPMELAHVLKAISSLSNH